MLITVSTAMSQPHPPKLDSQAERTVTCEVNPGRDLEDPRWDLWRLQGACSVGTSCLLGIRRCLCPEMSLRTIRPLDWELGRELGRL